ncbi:protein-glutamine gamma-glutamyltransferase 4 [Gastrophryne carolinensis]
MALNTLKVDFMKHENGRSHHTEDYDNEHLIVRRGHPFTLKITFSRELASTDNVVLQFATGARPMKTNGSLLLVEVKEHHELKKDWSGKICEKKGNEYLISVRSSPNSVIGKYSLSVTTGKGIVYSAGNCPIYMLFNPWCEDDSVHMPHEHERQEYVLNDTGYIYVGSHSKISARPWNFGQFEEDVLDCCMYLLDRSELKAAARKDPVIIARKFSALANSNDDRGILVGNWSGNYAAGTSPTAWTGSSAILQQFYKTKNSVSFGQCWVFSGVITTVMRCLGIPARSVTNFNSAHDTEENLKIDIYLNEQGEKHDISSDSVWNFHVWNDVWMKRHDLPSGYDGWQAIDGTPQELSQGIYQCGPCSLKAIKEGLVYLPYDGKFLFAEVNADRVEWLVLTEDEEYLKLSETPHSIGKHISTKAVNINMREDITFEYKHKEGSDPERHTFQMACAHLKSDVCRVFSAAPPSSPAIKLKVTGDKDLLPGDNLTLNIEVENESHEAKSVTVTAGSQLQTYTGKVIASVATMNKTLEVAGKQAANVVFNVTADQYTKSVITVEDELFLRVNVIAETKDKKLTETLMIPFTYPPIKVDMPETGKIDEDFTCTFTFKNTLKIPLEKCELNVEGLGIFKLEKFDHGDIPPGGIFRCKIVCAPKKAGEKKIVAELNSKQIHGISAERIINIAK